ncbi:MAG TPA: PPOX class F420-dependent oxidoreductase [Actinomycetota bacterium]|nr:PPOX class F420-dependent oxidoreductase [Actinomycetota bacterium]
MPALTDEDLELLTGRNFAHLAVIRPDGTPHVSVVWIDVADDRVLVNSAVGRVKDRYLRRDPRVSVTVHEEGDPYRWLRVDGSVEEFVTGDEAERHIDALNRRYHDGEAWRYTPGQQRVLYRIRPERVLRRYDD